MEPVLWTILIVIVVVGAISGASAAIQMAKSPYRDK